MIHHGMLFSFTGCFGLFMLFSFPKSLPGPKVPVSRLLFPNQQAEPSWPPDLPVWCFAGADRSPLCPRHPISAPSTRLQRTTDLKTHESRASTPHAEEDGDRPTRRRGGGRGRRHLIVRMMRMLRSAEMVRTTITSVWSGGGSIEKTILGGSSHLGLGRNFRNDSFHQERLSDHK